MPKKCDKNPIFFFDNKTKKSTFARFKKLT